MSGTIYAEAGLAANSILLGLGLMALYDGLWAFRLLVPHGTLWTGIEDLLYWIFSAICTFLLLFYQNDGMLRWYAVGGVFLGMAAYGLTAGKVFRRVLKKMKKYFTIRETEKISRIVPKKRKNRGKGEGLSGGNTAETKKE